jgi:PAS domain-containing protein
MRSEEVLGGLHRPGGGGGGSPELASLAAEGAAGEHENHWRAAGGGEAVVAWSTTPLLDEHGRPNFLISGMEITERKRQEEELRDSRKRLLQAGDAERRRLERNLHDGPSSASSRSRSRFGSRRRS